MRLGESSNWTRVQRFQMFSVTKVKSNRKSYLWVCYCFLQVSVVICNDTSVLWKQLQWIILWSFYFKHHLTVRHKFNTYFFLIGLASAMHKLFHCTIHTMTGRDKRQYKAPFSSLYQWTGWKIESISFWGGKETYLHNNAYKITIAISRWYNAKAQFC